MQQAQKIEALRGARAEAPAAVHPLSGWGLVALAFTNVAIAYAVVFSFPIFLPVLVEDFRASRGTVAAAFSWAISAVIRVSPSRVIIPGSLI